MTAPRSPFQYDTPAMTPDPLYDDRERCYLCAEQGRDVLLPADGGPCLTCGIAPDAPAMKWARATADDDPDGFRGWPV